MRARAVLTYLLVLVTTAPLPLVGQTLPFDSDVAKGVGQVNDGDYDGAIFTLDAAVRRLAASGAQGPDLAQAYLYLGVAYLAKGYEASARLQFQRALAQVKDLSVNPEKFSPKVIELFNEAREAARDEEAKSPAPPPRGEKKGGVRKGILIGTGAAAVAGAVVALAGGGSPPADTRKVETFGGSLCGEYYRQTSCDYTRPFTFVVSSPGTLDATVTWTDSNADFTLRLEDDSDMVSNRTTNTSAQLTLPVAAKAYVIWLRNVASGPPASFTLTVTHP
jgi:hypothetical protein